MLTRLWRYAVAALCSPERKRVRDGLDRLPLSRVHHRICQKSAKNISFCMKGGSVGEKNLSPEAVGRRELCDVAEVAPITQVCAVNSLSGLSVRRRERSFPRLMNSFAYAVVLVGNTKAHFAR